MPDNNTENNVEQSPDTPVSFQKPDYVRFKQSTVIIALVAVAAVGMIIHVLTHNGLEGSAILYVGIPLILAYAFINTNRSKSATGRILKGITIFLLMTGPFLQEGFICIIMAAPLFYIIGGIVGLITDHVRNKKKNKLYASPLIIVLALFSFEGTHPNLTFERNHTVRVEQIIEASTDAVEQQLQQPLSLGNDVPTFLKIFPFPTSSAFNGTQLGDENTLNFVYYKHFYFNAVVGDLTYKVTDRSDNHIESTVVSDDSYVSTYLNWKKNTVSWQAVDAKHTKVVWEIDYERKLDPAWYFGTLQHYAVSLLANSLVKYAATPEGSR